MKRESWSGLREIFLRLATHLRKYADMLLQKNEKSQAAHASKKSFFPSSEKSSIEILDAKISTKPTIVARYKSISEAVASSKPYDAICVNDYAPADKWPRHQYMKNLTINACVVHYTHTASQMNIYFVWKVPVNVEDSEMFDRSYKAHDELLAEMPVYHTVCVAN